MNCLMTTFCAFSHHHLPRFSFLSFNVNLYCKVFSLLLFLLFFHSSCCRGCEKVFFHCLILPLRYMMRMRNFCGIFLWYFTAVFEGNQFDISRVTFTAFLVCVWMCLNIFSWARWNDNHIMTFSHRHSINQEMPSEVLFFGRYDKLWATIMWWEAPNERKNQSKSRRT